MRAASQSRSSMGWGTGDGTSGTDATHVLLVEDSTPDAALIAELLADVQNRFALQRAQRLEEGCRALSDTRFDVILLDLRLPDARDLEALQRMRASAGDVPIVVLTGFEQGRLAQSCLEAGAEEFIEKARLSTTALLRAIDHAIVRARSRDLRRRLEHADRLATLGGLAAGVAHEINNPATFVQANVAMTVDLCRELREALPPDATAMSMVNEIAEMAEDTMAGIERIVAITKELNSFARREEARIEAVDVAELCKTAASIAASHVRHRAELELLLEPVPTIYADPKKLGQVVINLVVNAGQAILDGAPNQNRVRLGTQTRGEEVLIYVEDTGIGIEKENLERIFDPFFTTKPTEGTGLGLAIAADIVKAAGGRLTVESKPGEGSRFEIWIPINQDVRLPEPAVVPGPPAPLGQTRGRLLVIDDEKMLLRAMARMIGASHDIETVVGGAEALAILGADTDFDVIICDMMMPDVDGIHVYEKAVQLDPSLAPRFVFVTGGAITERASDFLARIELPVLTKPLSSRELLLAIDETLSQTE